MVHYRRSQYITRCKIHLIGQGHFPNEVVHYWCSLKERPNSIHWPRYKHTLVTRHRACLTDVRCCTVMQTYDHKWNPLCSNICLHKLITYHAYRTPNNYLPLVIHRCLSFTNTSLLNNRLLRPLLWVHYSPGLFHTLLLAPWIKTRPSKHPWELLVLSWITSRNIINRQVNDKRQRNKRHNFYYQQTDT